MYVVTMNALKEFEQIMHTVSFDWFLSGLEWILNLKFCYLLFCYSDILLDIIMEYQL